MPLPEFVPNDVSGLPLPELIDENVYNNAANELRVEDWRGLFVWTPDPVSVTYEAYTRHDEASDSQDKYMKYGAIVLALNGGASNAPVIGHLGVRVHDEIVGKNLIVPICVQIARTEPGAPFSYGARFTGNPSASRFMQQRFFPQKLRGFLL